MKFVSRTGVIVVAILCLGLVAPAVAGGSASPAYAAQDDDFPRAEAGVDQTVQRNASVLLDGTQSFSPDGELTEYIWQIESPDGDRVSVSCDRSDCGLARFRAPELGEYTVTLYVEDDDGQRESDTLYVQTVPRGRFGVELTTGPNATRGQVGNLTATIAPGRQQVQQLAWFQESRLLALQNVSDIGGTYTRRTYIAPGAEYSAVAIPEYGANVSDSWQAASSPDGWQWTTRSGEEIGIAGPGVVTGSPDGTGWRQTDVPYVLWAPERTDFSGAIWTANGQQVARAKQSVQIGLEAGNNRIQVEVPSNGSYSVGTTHHNATRSAIGRGGAQTTGLTAVYDPPPQIDRPELGTSGDSIIFNTEILDPYNGVERVRIQVGRHVSTTSESDISGRYRTEIEVPQYVHDETSVTVTLFDGRNQRVSYSETVSLPAPDPTEIAQNPSEEMSSHEYSDGGTSRSFP